jgi:hypothetical protein
MAKRAPVHESAYNPLDAGLAQSVIHGAAPPGLNNGTDLAERMVFPQRTLPVAAGRKGDADAAAVRPLTREKRVLLTPDEERQIERLVDRLGEQLGTSLKLSHLLRATMELLVHAEGEILRQAAALAPLPRPSNGDAIALAQFEHALSRLLSVALRDAPVLR